MLPGIRCRIKLTAALEKAVTSITAIDITRAVFI
jgi:hypothetical protein